MKFYTKFLITGAIAFLIVTSIFYRTSNNGTDPISNDVGKTIRKVARKITDSDTEDTVFRRCVEGQHYCMLFDNDKYGVRLARLNRSATYCEDLTSDWSVFNMSQTYYQMLPKFQAKIDMDITEGHSNQVPEEMMVLHYLASTESVRTVCETGFNYGHSSFNFLTSNPDLKVHSFDLGVHEYAKKMAVSLPEVIRDAGMAGGEGEGSRLTVRFGDSTVEVPKAISDKSLPLCDLMFVDGGHTYPVAKADILNFARHSSEHNIIIFDDYPTSWGTTFGAAWNELLISEAKADEILSKKLTNINETGSNSYKTSIKNVHIVETLRCTKRNLENNFQRGFVVGRVLIS